MPTVQEWDAAIKNDPASRRPKTLRLEEIDLPYLEVSRHYSLHSAYEYRDRATRDLPLLCLEVDSLVRGEGAHLVTGRVLLHHVRHIGCVEQHVEPIILFLALVKMLQSGDPL